MGRIRGFANVCKLLVLGFFFTLPAFGQYLGTVGQASTVSNYTIGASSAQTIIPTCDSTHTSNCIDMIGQVSHLVQVNYNSNTQCTILLDGSQDGTTWATIGSATFFAIALARFAQQTITANGWYQLIRLKANPGGGDTCGAMSGTYSGFQTPLPLSSLAQNFNSAAIKTAVNLSGSTNDTPYLLQGFSCYNPAGSVAWLDLFDQAASPTLGTDKPFFEQAIPAAGTFSFSGSTLEGNFIFWAAAVTTAGGSSAVSTAVSCNFQLNYNGPYVPLTPLSP